MPRTIIVGGGFVGLFTVLHLYHHKYPKSLFLIDNKDHFVFNPLLFELMTGEMTPDQVCPLYRELLKGSPITFLEDQVVQIDLPNKKVYLASDIQYDYDNLVLALGRKTGFFGVEGAKDYAFPFKTQQDAETLRQHLQECLKKASQTEDKAIRQSLLTFAIVGGGPTGIEMAETLGDLLANWYEKLDQSAQEIRIVIINRPQELLQGDINSHLREVVKSTFANSPVTIELILGASVTKVTSDTVSYQKDGKTLTINSNTTIWSAGTATNPLIENLSISAENRSKNGSLKVLPTLQLPEYPEVFAAGDCTVSSPNPLPATAQVAYQQGKAIADNLNAMIKGHPLTDAKVKLRGSMMKLGIEKSVANIFDRFEVTGHSGHLIREGTYLQLLPTPIHDFKVTTNWIIDELFDRHGK
jgi:NADH dehydrogenase